MAKLKAGKQGKGRNGWEIIRDSTKNVARVRRGRRKGRHQGKMEEELGKREVDRLQGLMNWQGDFAPLPHPFTSVVQNVQQG